jgi:hypothetical protein
MSDGRCHDAIGLRLRIDQTQEQRGKCDDILMIMCGNAMQVVRVTTAKVAKPGSGGFAAGQVIIANDVEQLTFDGGEAAVFPNAAPKASSGKQQIDMIECAQGFRQSGQSIARL